jgi:hypothetical protein
MVYPREAAPPVSNVSVAYTRERPISLYINRTPCGSDFFM